MIPNVLELVQLSSQLLYLGPDEGLGGEPRLLLSPLLVADLRRQVDHDGSEGLELLVTRTGDAPEHIVTYSMTAKITY